MLRGGVGVVIRGSPILVKRNPSPTISKPSAKRKAEDALEASAERHNLQSTSASNNNFAGEVRVKIGQGFGRISIRGIVSVLPRSPVDTNNHHNSNTTMMSPVAPNLPVVSDINSSTLCSYGNTNSSWSRSSGDGDTSCLPTTQRSFKEECCTTSMQKIQMPQIIL